MSAYPEHEKLQAVKEQSQICGEFLEWLHQKHFVIAVYAGNELVPSYQRTTTLLAEFFEIDEDKLEDEKMQMLEEFRKVRAEN